MRSVSVKEEARDSQPTTGMAGMQACTGATLSAFAI